MADGKHGFAKVLREAKRPMVIVGAAAAARADGAACWRPPRSIALAAMQGKDGGLERASTCCTRRASRVAGLDLGFVPGEGGLDVAGMLAAAGKGDLDVVYLLGADEIDMHALGKAFVIYQGSHGDAGAQRADVILPGAAYTEKSATYVNTEGRAQMTATRGLRAGRGQGGLGDRARAVGPCRPHAALRQPFGAAGRHVQGGARRWRGSIRWSRPASRAWRRSPPVAVRSGTEPFGRAVRDFYLTNPIARASAVMAELSALAQEP